MEVKFIKDHLDYKAGDIVTLAEGLSNYLIRTGVVEPLGETEKTPKPKKTTRKKK